MTSFMSHKKKLMINRNSLMQLHKYDENRELKLGKLELVLLV